MKPSISDPSIARRLDRRAFLSLGFSLAACAGCSTLLTRAQSPDEEAELKEKKLDTVGDNTSPWGLRPVKLESVGLVVNLPNTGSDPPPSSQRQLLINEMQSHEVANIEKLLASPKTSLALVIGYLPPGVRKGDRLDVEVRVPPGSETTSLRGGLLMPSRLRQVEIFEGALHTGNVDGLAGGNVLVDSLFDNNADKVLENRGRILSGAVSQKNLDLGLMIRKENASIFLSTLIGRAINGRFHTYDKGSKVGVATPRRDNYITLTIPQNYRHNILHYVRVVRAIPLRETPLERATRLPILEKQLLEPISAARAATQLEAIGKEAVIVLKRGAESSNPEVKFYAAEALAYLDETAAAKPLGETALNESAFRWHALTALTAMDQVAALETLNGLLHAKSVEARYGAFFAIRTRTPSDPTTKGEILGDKDSFQFHYHAIASTGEPVIHISRHKRPELVVFGHEQKFNLQDALVAGDDQWVIKPDGGQIKICRFSPNKEDRIEQCAATVDAFVRALVRAGGGYGDVIQILSKAQKAGALEGRVVADAMPEPGRTYYRDMEESSEAAPPDSPDATPPQQTAQRGPSAEAPPSPAEKSGEKTPGAGG